MRTNQQEGRARHLRPIFQPLARDAPAASPPPLSAPVLWTGAAAAACYGLWGYWWAHHLRYVGLDESVFTYVGWSWKEGYWPYLRSWDHKGPLIYVATMLRTTLLGNSTTALACQEILLGIAIVVLLTLIAHRLWGWHPAAVAFSLGVLAWAQARPETGFRQTPSSLIALFTTAAVLAGIVAARFVNLRRAAAAAIVAGCCGGLCFCTRPNALAGYVVALAALSLTGRQRQYSQRLFLVLLAIVGFLAPILGFGLLFLRAGVFAAFWDCYLVFNSLKGAHLLGEHRLVALLLRAISTLHKVGLLPIVAAVFAGAAVLVIRKSGVRDWLASSKDETLIFVWLGLELAVMVSSGSNPYHTLPVLSPAVLAGSWVIWAASQESASYWRLGLATLFALLFIPPGIRIAKLRQGTANVEWGRFVKRAAEETGQGDTLFSLSADGPALLNSVRRRSATRYVTTVPLMTQGYASDKRWAEMLQEFRDHPPRLIFLHKLGSEPTGDLRVMLESEWHPRYFGLGNEVDWTMYPSRQRFISFVADHYRLDYELGRRCLLRLIENSNSAVRLSVIEVMAGMSQGRL